MNNKPIFFLVLLSALLTGCASKNVVISCASFYVDASAKVSISGKQNLYEVSAGSPVSVFAKLKSGETVVVEMNPLTQSTFNPNGLSGATLASVSVFDGDSPNLTTKLSSQIITDDKVPFIFEFTYLP